jgi:hypothetical protein
MGRDGKIWKRGYDGYRLALFAAWRLVAIVRRAGREIFSTGEVPERSASLFNLANRSAISAPIFLRAVSGGDDGRRRPHPSHVQVTGSIPDHALHRVAAVGWNPVPRHGLFRAILCPESRSLAGGMPVPAQRAAMKS